jgi:hypothetical protein
LKRKERQMEFRVGLSSLMLLRVKMLSVEYSALEG